jgi:type VI secretion system secreted protein VgrG
MNASFKQQSRIGRLTTVLGDDVLNLLRFTGEEHLNGLFSYRLEALADRDSIDFDELLGTHMSIILTSFQDREATFDGIVTEANLLGQGENGWRYELVLKPWMWLLGLRRKQQIYHEMTVVEILNELFEPYASLGEPSVENRLTASYPKLEYTVQYRETDLDFATRLMERFGISYYFAHEEGSHTLIMTDTTASHDNVPGDTRKFQMVGHDHRADEEHLWEIRPGRRLTTGAIRLTDFNFKTPTAAMEAERKSEGTFAQGQIESYDYPGDYLKQSVGKNVAHLRADQERGQDVRHRAVGDCTTLRAGHVVEFTGDTVPGVGNSVCLSAQHVFTSSSFGSGDVSERPSYEGQYLFMPSDAPLAPERKTALPIVQGPQTAVVVGDGEIDCDEYGRILVRFHWDLDGRWSMRCRVSQNWAGKGWGGMIIPRIGMEVVVEFLEGDPDKPLVTGCVYNGKNDLPYELPANKTRSTFKTDTHQGNGFNEVRFEDKKSEEEILIHAQKDMHLGIRNNHSTYVGGHQHQQVDKNATNHVLGMQNNHSNLSGSLSAGRDLLIAAGQPLRFKANHSNDFHGQNRFYRSYPGITDITDTDKDGRPGTLYLTSKHDTAAESGGSFNVNAEENASVNGQRGVSVSSGRDMRVDAQTSLIQTAGDKMVLTAEDALVIKCGNAHLVLKANGDIDMVGKHLKFNGDKIWLN